MSRRILLILSVIIFLSAFASAQTGQRAMKFDWSRNGTNVSLGYLLSLPRNGSLKSVKPPMILFLHGSGERGTNVEAVKTHGPPKLVGQGRDLPFVIVSPQCPDDRHWNEPVILSALNSLVDLIVRRYSVDEDRIYLTGLSMGGFGAWGLASLSPGRFAVVVPVCGGGDRSMATNLKTTPVWIFHGAQDPVVPVSMATEMISALTPSDPNMKSTIYPDLGHDCWTVTYDNPDLYLWMLGWKKNAVRSDFALDADLKKYFSDWAMDYHYRERADDSGVKFQAGVPISYSLTRKNYSDKALQETVRWLPSPKGQWSVKPAIMGINLRPGEARTVDFQLSYGAGRNDFCLPSWTSIVYLDNVKWTVSTQTVKVDADDYFLKNPLTATAAKIKKPVIDGEISDKVWDRTVAISDFRGQDGSTPARYQTSFRTGYDRDNLYLAVTCEQSNLTTLVTSKTENDSNLWEDDSVEIFVAPVPGQRPYYQFVVNSAGFLYDANVWDRSWNSSASVATGISGTAWTVEIAIPLKSLGVKPSPKTRLGFEVSRNHKNPAESSQWCPTFAGNHAFARYGVLTLK